MSKLYLGCAQPPFHWQHYDLFPDLDDFVWVDKYIQHPKIKNWDALNLKQEVGTDTVDLIYASHLVEHLPHPILPAVLKDWFDLLIKGGELVINVPDMLWVAEQIIRYENMQPVNSNHYYDWEGEHGIQQIIYGSHAHDGEIHKSGFTQLSLEALLKNAGFSDINIQRQYDAHDMGVLLARAKK